MLNPPENVISTRRSSLLCYFYFIFCKIAIGAIYDLVQQADLIIFKVKKKMVSYIYYYFCILHICEASKQVKLLKTLNWIHKLVTLYWDLNRDSHKYLFNYFLKIYVYVYRIGCKCFKLMTKSRSRLGGWEMIFGGEF